MSEEPRAPTPAVHRTSPLYDFYGETLYPYVNHKMSGITPYLSINILIKVLSKELSHLSILLHISKFPPLIALDLEIDLEKDGGFPM